MMLCLVKELIHIYQHNEGVQSPQAVPRPTSTEARGSGALSPFELVETMQIFVTQKARQF